MLKWAVLLLVISLAAGWLGFTVIAGVAATIAKILFSVFLFLFLVFVIRGIAGYRRITK